MGVVNNSKGALPEIAKRISSVASDIVTVRLATVATDGVPPAQTQVVLDNDPSQTPINALGLNFIMAKGTRVVGLAYPPRGLVVLGSVSALPVSSIPQPEPVYDSGWISIGDPGAPAFTNGWANFASGWTPAGIRKIGNVVYTRGLIAGGTMGSGGPFFTLPVGFRPTVGHAMITGITNTLPATISGTVGGPSVNVTGAQSAGTAHTHSMQGHNHTTGSVAATTANAGCRLTVATTGSFYADSGTNGYIWIGGSFWVD